METFVTLLLVAAFGYALYRLVIKPNREKRKARQGGGGDRTDPFPRDVE